MSRETTKQTRSARRERCSRALYRSVGEHSTQLAEAEYTGIAPSQMQRMADPGDEARCIQAADVPALSHPVAVDMLRWQAQELGGVEVVESIAPSQTGDHLETLHRVLKENADVSIAYSAALADGVLTPSERMRVASELREAIAAQRSLLEMMERHERGAIVPVRRVK